MTAPAPAPEAVQAAARAFIYGYPLVYGLREVAAPLLATYKLPRAVVLVDRVSRSPSGKPDYAWARDRAVEAAG